MNGPQRTRRARLGVGWFVVLASAACGDANDDASPMAMSQAGRAAPNQAGTTAEDAGAGTEAPASDVVLDFSASPISTRAGNDTIFVPIHPPGTNLHATATDLLGAVAVNTRSGCSEFALMHAADQLPTAISSRDVASVDVTTDTEESFRDVSACIAYRTLDGWQPGPDAAMTTAPGAETAHLHFTLDAPGVDMLALGIRKSGATAVHEITIELR